jgi:hypothetical protein
LPRLYSLAASILPTQHHGRPPSLDKHGLLHSGIGPTFAHCVLNGLPVTSEDGRRV